VALGVVVALVVVVRVQRSLAEVAEVAACKDRIQRKLLLFKLTLLLSVLALVEVEVALLVQQVELVARQRLTHSQQMVGGVAASQL
jgi:hypothetical protein